MDDVSRPAPALSAEGLIWYRIHFSLDNSHLTDPLSVYLGLVGGADEVFLNGRLIGHTGNIGKDHRSAPRTVRLYDLPNKVLHQGENVLAIRVFNDINPRSLEGPFVIGLAEKIDDFAIAQSNKWITIDTSLALLSLFSLCAWCAACAAGFKGAKSWFTGATLLAVASMFAVTHPVAALAGIPAGFAWRTAQICYLLSSTLYLLALRAYLNEGPKWLVYGVAAATLVCSLSAVFSPLEFKHRMMEVAGTLMLCPIVFWTVWFFRRRGRARDGMQFAVFTSVALYSFGLIWGVFGNLSSWVTSSELQVMPSSTSVALSILALLAAGFIQLVQLREALAASQTKTLLAHHEARRQVAQDLHDGVVQELHATRIALQVAESLPAEERNGSISQVVSSLKKTTDALRLEAHELHLGQELTWVAFQGQLQGWARQLNIQLLLEDLAHLDEALPRLTTRQLHQILREAWANATRHSGCSQMSLSTKRVSGNLEILLRDNGNGFPSKRESTGIGLMTMRERTERIGGTFRLDTGAQGTILAVVIPTPMPTNE